LLVAMGETLPWPAALRVFFVGQLGKYLPGGVWSVLAQMDLGGAAGARRRTVGAVALVVMGVNVTTGALVSAVCLPFTSAHALHRAAWVLVLVPAGLVLLHPRVLTTVVNRALRLLRRDGLDMPLGWGGVLTAAAWSLVMWLCYGVHVALLARSLPHGQHRVLLLATGAYALAWVVGFVIVVAPAGAGAREGMLVVALAVALSSGAATAVAIVSRLLMTAGDFVCAALAAAVGTRAVRPQLPETSASRR
jgi:hypothetical protein